MKAVLKQVLGVNVAKDELVVTLGRMFDDLSLELYAYKVFKNKESEFCALVQWVEKLTKEDLPVHYVMEATGVYHQKFAFYLFDKGCQLSIVLPNKISNYIRTLEIKTTTDKTCSEAIAQFGLERKLDLWQRPHRIYKYLQQLTRERDQIVSERAMVKNQLHAETHEAEPNEKSLVRLKERIEFLNKQEKEIKKDITSAIARDHNIKSQISEITTITGIGALSAIVILAETNGFELIRSKKQLTSYAGLDVKKKQSGTSIKGKPRISKRGNKSLRKAMHFPALTAVRHDENFRSLYARIVAKHGIKMKAYTAVQRKLLEMVYVIFKSKAPYDKEYELKKNRVQKQIA
ncbi:IS110 family transposase [Flavobacterium sp. DGU11]|uniref:IS110 family transposase n=1 Tax=Flavobacterium arundinis TaxID=3139143 RepID=A0ABU9HV64_9FLAO